MLCALITPSPDERTDFGEIDPFIVLINFMDGETTSPCAGVAKAQSEVITIKVRKRLRIPTLY